MSENQGNGATPPEGAEPNRPKPERAELPPIVAPSAPPTLSELRPAPPVAPPGTEARQSTPPTQEDNTMPPRKRRGGRIAASVVGGVVVLAAAVYVGSVFLTQDRLPAHLTVDGVDVSGQSVQQAKASLDKELGARAQQPVKLAAGEQSVSLKPADAGLGVDVDSTLQRLTGRSWDPSVVAARIFGTQDAQVDRTRDDAALTAQVKKAASGLDTDPVEGTIAIAQGKADYTAPTDGVTVDQAATADALSQQWLHADGTVRAVTKESAPKVSAADWKSFLDGTVTPLLDGPITVADSADKAALSANAVGSAATISTDSGKPELKLDGDKLVTMAVSVNPKLGTDGNDATVKLVGKGASAHVQVVPAKTGRGLKGSDVAAAVQKAAQSTDRVAAVKLTTTQPKVSTAQAKAWKMVKVAEFATPYPYEPTRTKNLVAGSGRVNGTVVQPGEEFNLANVFGPITAANGYFSSGVVENGVSSEALGGGLSQIATMSYNAGFLSGMDILQHQPHSRWFDRYPAGRESTYWEGQINVRWKNNTSAPVVVQMYLEDNHVKMAVWGVKTWTVKTTTSEHYNVTNPATVHSNTAQCVPENSGIKGFTVSVTRDRKSAKTTLPHEVFTWTYQAWPHVICDKK